MNNAINNIKAEIVALRNKATAHDLVHNEGGYGYNPYTAKIDDAIAALDAMTSEFAGYRAAWNAAVAKYTGPKGVNCADLANIEAEAGITKSMLLTIKAKAEG